MKRKMDLVKLEGGTAVNEQMSMLEEGKKKEM